MSAIVNGRYTKGVSFLLNMVYKRGKGLDLGADPPPPGRGVEQARFCRGAGTVFQGRSQDFSRGTHKFPKPLPQTP